MPAYARPDDLLVVLERSGQPTDEQTARDGVDAVAVATAMLLARTPLEPGDRLSIRRAEPPAELPEVSRASHSS
jgi:hypothetical protein